MPTRNVVFTERHETLIEALVQSGRYQNASEVLREGPGLVENREIEEATKLGAVREAALVGLSAFDRGEFKEFAETAALVAHLDKIRIASSPPRKALDGKTLVHSAGRRIRTRSRAHSRLHTRKIRPSATRGVSADVERPVRAACDPPSAPCAS